MTESGGISTESTGQWKNLTRAMSNDQHLFGSLATYIKM